MQLFWFFGDLAKNYTMILLSWENCRSVGFGVGTYIHPRLIEMRHKIKNQRKLRAGLRLWEPNQYLYYPPLILVWGFGNWQPTPNPEKS